MRIVAILLAAGRSLRFGGDKLLHPLPDGTPLVARSLQTLRTAVPDTRVVVPANAPAMLRCLQDYGAESVVCNACHFGMGASLACGVRATGQADAWLVALADMPFLRIETIRKVTESLIAGAPLVAAMCNGQRGHPVGFAREFGPALLQLAGDSGARELLAANMHRLKLVETGDPGVLQDIDYPADLNIARAPCD